MQGVVLMPQNPQQGSPPPNNSIESSDMAMEAPNVPQPRKDTAITINQSSDSGIFSATCNSLEPETTATTCDTDNRSECSSTPDEEEEEEEEEARKYVCPICDTMLTSQHQFTLHIRSHNNNDEAEESAADKGYTCRICLKVLSSSSSLDRHVLVHSGERPFHCKHCGVTFTTNGNMHRHMRTHKDNYESDTTSSDNSTEYNNNTIEGKYKRKLESPADDSNSKRTASSTTATQLNRFKCPVCDRTDFDSILVLETHLEDNHPDHFPAKCTDCSHHFASTKQLALHRNTVHGSHQQQVMGFKDLTFVDFSSNKFPHIARYECEKNLHKVSSGLRFQCTKCSRAFPCASSLEIHEKECLCMAVGRGEGLDLSRATLCDSELRRNEFFARLDLQDNSPEKAAFNETSNRLRQQLLAKAISFDAGKDLADIQSIISMTSNGGLLQQLKNEKEEMLRPGEQEEESQDVFAVEFRKMKLRGEFPCRLCTAVFPNLRALKGHNRAHLNGNNNGLYRCNMCPHSSIDKAALIRHMRTHNGDRPYECSLCNYAFTTKANCERHLRNRHAKTTREEVKKSIIYHPSEDPTNEDLNKLNKEDGKKSEDLHCTTPKLADFPAKPEVSLLTDPLMLPEQPKILSKINDIIRSENLKSMKDLRIQNAQIPAYLPYNFSPKSANVSTPRLIPPKIQVKSFQELKETSFDSDNDDIEDEPMDLVLDLSKKSKVEPEDLSNKSLLHQGMSSMFAQELLKTPPKTDPAAFYATQLALCRQNFPGFPPAWGIPINPLLFQSLQNSLLPQQDRERLQRFNLCGGSMISDFPYAGYKMPDLKPAEPSPKKDEPLSLNIDSNSYSDSFKLSSPLLAKPDAMIQSPNSVKMVIKNGVLMPKQKQRRYRTERPFTCEHCSARFTLRSNMERHIKQQHPQFWSQRQRGHSVSGVGRKSKCDLAIPSYELPNKGQDFDDTSTKEQQHEKLKLALLAHHVQTLKTPHRDDDDHCGELIIDEKTAKIEEHNQRSYESAFNSEKSRILEDKLKELHAKQFKNEHNKVKSEEDLVPVSRLLDNASQQPFKDYFKREQEEPEAGGASEEDEEGLVASGSTSEGNISGTDENKSESETVAPVKKKSAYSMAPNRVSCPFCNRKFPWSSSLRRHILTHTGQKPFKCSHCPLLFTTKSNCDRHLLRKHGNNATTISNEVINNNNTSYLMRNVPERPFKCSSCPSSTFSTYSNLKKHISSKHAASAHQCDDIRGYDAGSSEDEKLAEARSAEWEGPSSSASSDLPFKCHLCEGSFGERQEALDHIRDKHYSEYSLLMSKNALDASATTPDDGGGHHEDDESEMRGKFPDYSNRKVICAFCMRRFWSAEDLRRHMRTHTGERPFSCDICSRRFTLKHSMLRHRKKHNNVKSCDTENGYSDEEQRGENGGGKEESDGNEGGGDLISNLLGIRDRSFIDKVLTASADDAAKLLGVKNGVKE